jgi:hypothetical protein
MRGLFGVICVARGRRNERFLLAVLGSVLAIASHAVAETTVIAKTDQPVPEGNGLFYYFFAPPSLNASGQVAFSAALKDTSGVVTDDSGIYFYNGAAVVNRARENAPVPEGNGLFDGFDGFPDRLPSLNASGRVAFYANLKNTSGASADNSGIYLHNGTSLVNRVRENAAVPEGNGLFNSFSSNQPLVNGAGQVAFFAFLKNTSGGGNDNSGIYLHNGTTLLNRVRQNANVPEGNGQFSSFAAPRLNSNGQIAFSASLKNTSGGTADNAGIYFHNGTTLVNRVRENTPVPEGNGLFDGFGFGTAVNTAGEIAFGAVLKNTSGGTADDSGLYLHNGSTLTNLVRKNAAVPEGNGKFTGFGPPSLNDAGLVAFEATLKDTIYGQLDNRGLYLYNGTTVVNLARSFAADQPNSPFVFDDFVFEPTINAAGIVAFHATLRDHLGLPAGSGIYLANGVEILPVARYGQLLEGVNTTSLDFASGSSAEGNSGFNDLGQVAYRAGLIDGTAAIVRYTIPELHWTSLQSGLWTLSKNWSDQFETPTSFHDTFIDPASGVTVTGSAENRYVKSLTIGATASGEAVLALNNGGDLRALESITINARGRIDVGTGRVLAAPSITNSGVLTGDGQIAADVINLPGGEIRVGAGQRLHITSGAGHANQGKVEVFAGEIEFGGFITINFASTGLITGQNATLRFDGGLMNDGSLALTFGVNNISGDINNRTGSKIIVAGGAHATFYDDVTQNGTLQVIKVGTTNSVAVFAGAFTGSGGSSGGGDIFFLGDLRPGNSPAIVNFDNNIGFGPTTTLDIELGGVTPGSQFDRLQISGAATLDGILDVSLINGFAPALGNSFEILRAEGGIFGAFSDVMLPELATGLLWNVVYSNFSVLLQVAPGLLGDYNEDGSVDAADYVVWRKTDGSQAGYDLWRTNFGRMAGSGSADHPAGGAPSLSQAAVPEPAGIVLVLGALLAGVIRRHAR